MSAKTYVIPDEPQPGALAQAAVNPSWPLLAMMMGGTWLSLPWFLFNGAAIGSPNLRREVATAIATVATVLGLAIGASMLVNGFGLPQRTMVYVYVVLAAVKLAGSYWLFRLQNEPFRIHLRFGGRARQGAMLALASYFVRSTVLAAAFSISPWLGIVVA